MTSRLVLVNQSLANRFIDCRNSLPVSGLGSFGIAGGNRFNNILDMNAQRRTLTDLALTAAFRLTGALTCLSRVCQNGAPVPDSKERATIRIIHGIVYAA